MTTISVAPVEPTPVTNLTISEDLAGTGVLLSFTIDKDPNQWSTEIWASDSNDRTLAVLVDTVVTDTYLYSMDAGISKYFWIRSVNVYGYTASTWYPVSSVAGVLGTAGAVNTKDIAPNATSLHAFGATNLVVTGDGGPSYTSVVTFSVTNDSDIAIPFSFTHFCKQSYSAGVKDTKWIIRDVTSDITIFDWGTITSIDEMPALASVYTIAANTTKVVILYWWGEDDTVSITNRSFQFLGLKA